MRDKYSPLKILIIIEFIALVAIVVLGVTLGSARDFFSNIGSIFA